MEDSGGGGNARTASSSWRSQVPRGGASRGRLRSQWRTPAERQLPPTDGAMQYLDVQRVFILYEAGPSGRARTGPPQGIERGAFQWRAGAGAEEAQQVFDEAPLRFGIQYRPSVVAAHYLPLIQRWVVCSLQGDTPLLLRRMEVPARSMRSLFKDTDA